MDIDLDMIRNNGTAILQSIISNPLNVGLLLFNAGPLPEPELPPMKKRDMSISELREFDGVKNDGRILMAVNGKIFDVSRGRKFYGPEGPYGAFAGRDATRGLAQFRLDKEAIKDEYDDISDLNAMEMDSVREWEMQFSEKYDFVGRLLKPGEEPTDYSDMSEPEHENKENESKGKVKEE